MGVPMGAPFFKIKQLMREGLIVRSSNYALYGDLSNRVMVSLAQFSPQQEIYSIDECFLGLDGFEHLDLRDYGLQMRQTVLSWTGLPVGIGIARTKTLSKLANHMAKKNSESKGVEVLLSRADLHYALANAEIGDIWGIGRRWSKKLKAEGVYHALDLVNRPDNWIRKHMGINGLRTAFELRGTSCINLEETAPDKKTTCVSRSFGQMLFERQDLEDAINTFASRAAEKCRRDHLVAQNISIFLSTNRHRAELPQYRPSITLKIDPPCNDSRLILQAALTGLRRIYRPGYHYKQAGITLLGLTSEQNAPTSLFSSSLPQDDALMSALDGINKRYGEGALNIGQCHKSRSWYATRNYCSPRYTTSWQDLPKVS